MVDIPTLIKQNQTRWDKMVLDNTRIPAFDAIAKRLALPENKIKFQAVTTRLKTAGYQPVPWWFIAIMSEREYGGPQSNGKGWDKQLAQGDPLNERSTHEPVGRGPFLDHPGDNSLNNAWVRGALDALIDCAPHAALWNDWTVGGVMTIWEEDNGLGYAMRGVPSAYVWSGTNQYISGKFVADHVYRAGVKDVQEGCAPILNRMMLLDKTITFGGVEQVTVPPSHPAVKPVPITGPVGSAPLVTKGSLVQELLNAFWKL